MPRSKLVKTEQLPKGARHWRACQGGIWKPSKGIFFANHPRLKPRRREDIARKQTAGMLDPTLHGRKFLRSHRPVAMSVAIASSLWFEVRDLLRPKGCEKRIVSNIEFAWPARLNLRGTRCRCVCVNKNNWAIECVVFDDDVFCGSFNVWWRLFFLEPSSAPRNVHFLANALGRHGRLLQRSPRGISTGSSAHPRHHPLSCCVFLSLLPLSLLKTFVFLLETARRDL